MFYDVMFGTLFCVAGLSLVLIAVALFSIRR